MKNYRSKPALNGAMVNPNEITAVGYYEEPFEGTVPMYVTDGWRLNLIGCYKPEDLDIIAEKILNKPMDVADDWFSAYVKKKRA